MCCWGVQSAVRGQLHSRHSRSKAFQCTKWTICSTSLDSPKSPLSRPTSCLSSPNLPKPARLSWLSFAYMLTNFCTSSGTRARSHVFHASFLNVYFAMADFHRLLKFKNSGRWQIGSRAVFQRVQGVYTCTYMCVYGCERVCVHNIRC